MVTAALLSDGGAGDKEGLKGSESLSSTGVRQSATLDGGGGEVAGGGAAAGGGVAAGGGRGGDATAAANEVEGLEGATGVLRDVTAPSTKTKHLVGGGELNVGLACGGGVGGAVERRGGGAVEWRHRP